MCVVLVDLQKWANTSHMIWQTFQNETFYLTNMSWAQHVHWPNLFSGGTRVSVRFRFHLTYMGLMATLANIYYIHLKTYLLSIYMGWKRSTTCRGVLPTSWSILHNLASDRLQSGVSDWSLANFEALKMLSYFNVFDEETCQPMLAVWKNVFQGPWLYHIVKSQGQPNSIFRHPLNWQRAEAGVPRVAMTANPANPATPAAKLPVMLRGCCAVVEEPAPCHCWI